MTLGNSPHPPDLNPMEHVWAHVKWKLNEYLIASKRMPQLWEHVQASFHTITLEQCQKFIRACPIVFKLFLLLKEGGQISDL